MFSRNEKYGQALHLQYGYEAFYTAPVTAPRKGFFASLISFLTSSNVNDTQTQNNDQLELALDKAFINHAVQNELRNTDTAANENGPAIRHAEIA